MWKQIKRISYIHGAFIIKDYLVRHLREALDNEYDESAARMETVRFHTASKAKLVTEIESLLNDIEGQ
jgi:hypothetical protein